MSITMRTLLAAAILFCILAPPVEARDEIRGTLKNDNDPWFVSTADGVYKAEWQGGSILFWEGDEVLLTVKDGFGYMIGLTGLSKGHKAYVWIEGVR